MKNIKQWDHSKVHLNCAKLVYKQMMDFGYGCQIAQNNKDFVKDCMGCCIFRNHEIALNLKQIDFQFSSNYKLQGICNNIYELICMVLSHEVIELLCNDEMHDGGKWHHFAGILRHEGYKC